MARLTDSVVANLSPKTNGREQIVRDQVVRGLILRVGARRKSFGLRIERKGRPAVYSTLGAWPDMKVAEARAAANDALARYERKEPVSGPTRDEATIASVLPLKLERLRDKHASEWTLGWYETAAGRLSATFKETPLKDLAKDPVLVADEIQRIRRERRNGLRGGASAGTATARFIKTIFKFAQKRDPELRGDPTSAVEVIDPERFDLPALATSDMATWFAAVQKIPREHHREAHLFCLLSGLRRDSLVKLQWKDLDLRRRCIRVPEPKGGQGRAFDLVLSRAMIRCLWRARRVGRRLFREGAETWVFAGPCGHVRGDALTKDSVLANHSLRRGFATAATDAGVDEDVVGKILNHSGKTITAHYVRTSYLGRMLAGAMEDISAHIIKSLGRAGAKAGLT